jgi:hypothetical protein
MSSERWPYDIEIESNGKQIGKPKFFGFSGTILSIRGGWGRPWV